MSEPDKVHPEETPDLRLSAERQSLVRMREQELPSPERVLELLHELQVHQIELEVQNEALREARGELEASRDRFANLYDFAPVGYVTLDEKGIIREINLTACEMLGCPRSQLLERPLVAYVDEQQRRGFRRYLSRLRQAPPSRLVSADATLRTREGGTVFALLRTRPIDNPHAGGRQYHVAIMDISQWKEAEGALASAHAAALQAHNRLEAVMDALPIGVAIVGKKGGTIRANAAFERIWGGPRPSTQNVADYAAYRAWWTDSGELIQPEEWASARAVKHGETVIGQELEIERFDGTRAFVLNSASPVRDAEGLVVGAAVSIVDITDRKQAEHALQRHAAVLAAINRIFEEALCANTAEGLGEVCLEVAKEATQSRIAFMGELNSSTGVLDEIAISAPGWEACRTTPGTVTRHPPRSIKIEGLYGRVIVDGKGFFTNEPGSYPSGTGGPPGLLPLEAFLGVPLVRHGDVVGMIAVANRPGGYHPEQLAALDALAPAMLHAIDHQRAELALRDFNLTLEQRVAERTAVAERRSADLRRLAAELTDVEHRERKRLAQLLHDDLQQLLVAARLQLPQPGDQDRNRSDQRIGKVDELLNECATMSRSLAQELSPPILQVGTVADVVGWITTWFGEKHGLSVEVETQGVLPSLPEHLRVFVFQAVRELLFNVVKHSGQLQARVVLGTESDFLAVQVEDDGRGLDPRTLEEGIRQPVGLGLFGIRERIEALGGRIEIRAASQGGARFRLLVPVPAGVGGEVEEVEIQTTEPDEGPRPKPPGNDSVLRLLLVDDHAIVREGFAELLQGEPDFEVVGEAADGAQAIHLTDSPRFMLNGRTADSTGDQADDEQHQEDEKEDLRDAGRTGRDSAKPEHSGDHGHDEEQ